MSFPASATMRRETDVLIIGGGFFGLSLAAHFTRQKVTTQVCEAAAAVMTRASYANQARVHGGYHYPRSILTAQRSRANLPRFKAEYGPAIREYTSLYAIARNFSKVSAAQFEAFAERIRAPLSPAPPSIQRLFDRHLVERAYLAEEYAFDAAVLARLCLERLPAGTVRTATQVSRVRAAAGTLIAETAAGPIVAQRIYICLYSNTNTLLRASALPIVPYRLELAEIALIDVPPALATTGITVMCGPFFSVTPFPATGQHALTHVRYTPARTWSAGEASSEPAEPAASAEAMRRDAQRYVPLLRAARYRRSLWETKVLLPQNEVNDGRPILLSPHHGLPNLHVVIGGKIDNVFDVISRLDETV